MSQDGEQRSLDPRDYLRGILCDSSLRKELLSTGKEVFLIKNVFDRWTKICWISKRSLCIGNEHATNRNYNFIPFDLRPPQHVLHCLRSTVAWTKETRIEVFLIRRSHVVCFRGNAQIYSGTAEHVAGAAMHKSAVRGVQELRKVSRRWRIIEVLIDDRLSELNNLCRIESRKREIWCACMRERGWRGNVNSPGLLYQNEISVRPVSHFPFLPKTNPFRILL